MPAIRSKSVTDGAGFELEPLADYALTRIKQSERVFADETTLPALAGIGQGQDGLPLDLFPR